MWEVEVEGSESKAGSRAKVQNSISKKQTKAKRAGGLDQVVEQMRGPEFKSQYCPNNRVA
jgi:hypothetical protein